MTEQEYITGLERLRAAEPGNLLLRKLSAGASVVNGLLLKKALEKLGADHIVDVTKMLEPDEVFEQNDPTDDQLLRTLRRELSGLFSERNRLSDLFRSLKTDAQRAENSENIQLVQRRIERQMLRVRHYKIHGTLPEGDTGRHYIPKDGLELSRKQASLRASISRKKKDVAKAESADLADPRNARKLEKELDSLRDLRGQLVEVDKAIAALKN